MDLLLNMIGNKSKLSRRAFLNNVGGGALITTGITGETIGSVDKISVPYIKSGDEVIEEVEVNKK